MSLLGAPDQPQNVRADDSGSRAVEIDIMQAEPVTAPAGVDRGMVDHIMADWAPPDYGATITGVFARGSMAAAIVQIVTADHRDEPVSPDGMFAVLAAAMMAEGVRVGWPDDDRAMAPPPEFRRCSGASQANAPA